MMDQAEGQMLAVDIPKVAALAAALAPKKKTGNSKANAKAKAKAAADARASAEATWHIDEPDPRQQSLAHFFQRRTEAAAVGRPMPQSAAATHEAVGNHLEQQTSLPRQLPPLDPADPDKLCCHMCLLWKCKTRGRITGKGDIFYCSDCTACETRISRMTSNRPAAKLWKNMSVSERQEFRQENNALKDAALRDALSVRLVQKHLEIHSEATGKVGEYLPLSVYRTRGYDQDWLDWIENHCSARQEGPGFTYALNVAFEKMTDEIKDITTSIWRPLELMNATRGSKPSTRGESDDDGEENDDSQEASTDGETSSSSSSGSSDSSSAKKKEEDETQEEGGRAQ